MTISIGKSFTLAGIDAYPVTIEVDIRKDLVMKEGKRGFLKSCLVEGFRMQDLKKSVLL